MEGGGALPGCTALKTTVRNSSDAALCLCFLGKAAAMDSDHCTAWMHVWYILKP